MMPGKTSLPFAPCRPVHEPDFSQGEVVTSQIQNRKAQAGNHLFQTTVASTSLRPPSEAQQKKKQEPWDAGN